MQRELITTLPPVREQHPSVFVDCAKKIGELAIDSVAQINQFISEFGAGLGVFEPKTKSDYDS